MTSATFSDVADGKPSVDPAVERPLRGGVLAGVHVVVGVPAYAGLTEATATAINGTVELLQRVGVHGSVAMVEECASIDLARAELVQRMRSDPDASHLLFVDADVAFDPSAVATMLELDLPVVVGAYRHRSAPHDFVVSARRSRPFERHGHRLIRAHHAGIGFALVRRDVLERLCTLHPELHFERGEVKVGAEHFALFLPTVEADDGDVQRYHGEDVAFFRRVRAAGFDLHVAIDVETTHAGLRGRFGDLFPNGSQPFAQPGDALLRLFRGEDVLLTQGVPIP